MIERFLKQTKFTSEQDFKEHLEFIIPEDFNFAYDVMDEWAKIKPDHVALLWASERGEEIRFTYKDLKEQSDKAAAYFQSLGIGHDDKVMLILKRHYQWWLENADYFRCENISVAYTFPRSVTKLADIRLSLSAQNLFTITGYKGIDPAGASFGEKNIDRDNGLDMGAYPNPRTITMGVRVTF